MGSTVPYVGPISQSSVEHMGMTFDKREAILVTSMEDKADRSVHGA